MNKQKHYPFNRIVDVHTRTIVENDVQWPLTIILYTGSAVSTDAGIRNGLALIKDNAVIIDNIGQEGNTPLPATEQKRLFYIATQLKTIEEVHAFIYEYGDPARYRGVLD